MDKWPSAVVALRIFGVLGAVLIVAIVTYDTADEAMTVFAGLWGALGAGFGLVFAYFFSRGPISEATKMATEAGNKADKAMEMEMEAGNKADEAMERVKALEKKMASMSQATH